MNENEELFVSLCSEIHSISDSGASGVFSTYFDDIKATKTISPTGYIRIFLWPNNGGCIVLNPDGTWDGDIAPGAG